MTRNAFLGGFKITRVGWVGPAAVEVRFTTDETGFLYQLYAGRTRIGSTDLTTARRLVGQLFPDPVPTPLTVVRVTPANRLTDFGPLLPRWPWNRFRLTWTASGFPADSKLFEISSGTEPGGAVDLSNIVGRVLFTINGDYQFDAPPVARSGEWNYAIRGRDGTSPNGNAGTAAEVSVDALVIPPDVTPDSAGNRFSLSVDSGVLTADFNY